MSNRTKKHIPDGWVMVGAFCPACWFREESKFHVAVPEAAVRGHFKKLHTLHNAIRENPCTLAPRVPRFENPVKTGI